MCWYYSKINNIDGLNIFHWDCGIFPLFPFWFSFVWISVKYISRRWDKFFFYLKLYMRWYLLRYELWYTWCDVRRRLKLFHLHLNVVPTVSLHSFFSFSFSLWINLININFSPRGLVISGKCLWKRKIVHPLCASVSVYNHYGVVQMALIISISFISKE